MMTDYIKKITLTAVVMAFCLVTSSFAADTEKSTQEIAVVNAEKREPVAYRLRLRELTLNRKAYEEIEAIKIFGFLLEIDFPDPKVFLLDPGKEPPSSKGTPDAIDQFQVLYDGSKFKDIPVKDGAFAVACFDIDAWSSDDTIFTITIRSEDVMKKDENGKIRFYIDSNGKRALDVNEPNRKKIENKEYHQILFSVEEIYITEMEDMVKIPNKNYSIGRYEVTQKRYKEIMGENPSYHKGDDFPVENVSWHDAVAFCEKLTKYSRESGLIKNNQSYRLPTSEEWEYACRAGTTTKYCIGDSDEELSRVAWYNGNSDLHSHRVGEKKPNAWGIYDMHGNVWEWCWGCVNRGGGFHSDAGYCNSSFVNSTWERNPYLGFRIVLVQGE